MTGRVIKRWPNMRRPLAASRAVTVAAVAWAVLSAPAAAQPLVVATEPQAAAAPLIIAAERGWFAEEGLDVSLVHFHANVTMVTALAQGDVDVALIDLSAEAFAMAAEHELRIIAGAEELDPDYPRYAWLLAADRSADGIGALGRDGSAVLGVTEPGAAARYLFDRMLDGDAQLAFVAEGSDVALAAALSQGRVDAALLPAHLAADLEATGAAVVSGWAGAVEGPVSLSVLMTTAAQSRLRPDVIKRFLRAYVRGVRAYHEMVLDVGADEEGLAGAERSALVEVIADGARRPAAEVAAALPYIASDARLNPASLAQQLAWWKEQGACGRDVAMTALVDLAPLNAAIASLADEATQEPAIAVSPPGDGEAGPTVIDPSAVGGPQQEPVTVE